MPQQPEATLANWREAPQNRWSFHNVQSLITTASIAAGPSRPLPRGSALDLSSVQFSHQEHQHSVAGALTSSTTDGFLLLHRGQVIAELLPNLAAASRHILFSVSKSVTGTLAGILVDDGKLDPDAPVIDHIPEAAHSAYGDCTVRHVLDMTVSLDFVENYLDTQGAFARYRVATGWNPPNPAFGGAGLHQFLCTLPRGRKPHGETFFYASPNSDLLGWILERASGEAFASLASRLLWQPMGAEHDALITLDGQGASRTAGGICTSLHDLARFAELMRLGGAVNGRQIIPQGWIADIYGGGDPACWARGAMTPLFPGGSYRSQWYRDARPGGALVAIGIHGQWIYIDRRAEMTAIKFSSEAEPADTEAELLTLAMFAALARQLA